MNDWVAKIEFKEDPSNLGRKVASILGISCGGKNRWQYSVRVSKVKEIFVMPVFRFLGNNSSSRT